MSGFEGNNGPGGFGEEGHSPQDRKASRTSARGPFDGRNSQYPDPEESSLHQHTHRGPSQYHAQAPANSFQYDSHSSPQQAQKAPVLHAQHGSQVYGSGPQNTAAFALHQPQAVAAINHSNTPRHTGAPSARWAGQPAGFQPKDSDVPVYSRDTIEEMTDAGRRGVHQPPSATRNEPREIVTTLNYGRDSGMFWFGFFDPTRPTVPVTKCQLKILRGRGSEGRGASHAWQGKPGSHIIIPAGLSLHEICRDYPNHVWGEMLRLFMSEGWDARRIYENFPEAVRMQCQKDSDKKKSHSGRPHNFLQAAMGREIDIMMNEDGRYRRITPNPRKGHKRARPQPGDSGQPVPHNDDEDDDDYENGRSKSLKRSHSQSPRARQQAGRSPSDAHAYRSGPVASFARSSPLASLQPTRGSGSPSLPPYVQVQSPRLLQNQMHLSPPPAPYRSMASGQPGMQTPVSHAGYSQIGQPAQASYQHQRLYAPHFSGMNPTQAQPTVGLGDHLLNGASRSQNFAGRASLFDQYGGPSIGGLVALQQDEQIRALPRTAGLSATTLWQQEIQSQAMFAQSQAIANGTHQVRAPESITPTSRPENDDKKEASFVEFKNPFGDFDS